MESLQAVGVNTIFDLLWIMPLKIFKMPNIEPISKAVEGKYFRGSGKVVSFQARPNFKAHGKGRVPLNNLTIVVMDESDSSTLQLKWFNCYPSVTNKLREMEIIHFAGVIQSFQGNLQVISPETSSSPGDNSKSDDFIIQYPTVNGISSTNLKKLILKIPEEIWDANDIQFTERSNFFSLMESMKILHGKVSSSEWTEDKKHKARESLAYFEFFCEQLKHKVRKNKLHHSPALIMNIEQDEMLKTIQKLFPYDLTVDQEKSLFDVFDDFKGPGPMMRMIQGDVGCGKTTVAFGAAIATVSSGHQAAIMAPTESLAIQHYKNFKKIAIDADLEVALLLGATSNTEKKEIAQNLLNGKVQIIIGTHSLFQDSVQFKSLGLAVIDEQHKFGVNQRLKLVGKTPGCHCLLMTATPIPRSLSLTQYGDLEISIIKTLPGHRKGFKTRIISPETYPKFLSFLKTRISMGEQSYIVVPAIEESENMDTANLIDALKKFQAYFPDLNVEGLHGQLKSEEKQKALHDFNEGKIDVLVSTSVVEVGIDVENATIMAIINPERFGLSSLHQLRGRVGRGSKPGFCFLVCEKIPSQQAFERLRVIENTDDGFKIAEEDLKIRGEGDIFGTSQSGSGGFRRIANIITDYPLLEIARADVEKLSIEDDFKNHPIVKLMAQNDHVVSTV